MNRPIVTTVVTDTNSDGILAQVDLTIRMYMADSEIKDLLASIKKYNAREAETFQWPRTAGRILQQGNSTAATT